MGVATDPFLVKQVWSEDGQDYKALQIQIDTQGDGPGAGSRAFEIVVDDAVVFAVDKSGNVTKGGMAQAGVSATSANLTVTQAEHAGRVILLNRAAGVTATLPAATGTGAKYEFIVGTAASGGSYIIKVADATDVMAGTAYGDDGDGEPANGWPTAADSDTVTMDGSTKGGLIGDRFSFVDIALNTWAVLGFMTQGGSEATPFSAAVP